MKNGKKINMTGPQIGGENDIKLGWIREWGRVRDFYCIQGTMKELASIFTYGISNSCMENVSEVNRGSRQTMGELFQGSRLGTIVAWIAVVTVEMESCVFIVDTLWRQDQQDWVVSGRWESEKGQKQNVVSRRGCQETDLSSLSFTF